MDSEVLQNSFAQPVTRRLTRSAKAHALAVNSQPTPRGPLKRTRRGAENKIPPAAANGAKEMEGVSENHDVSTSKKRKLDVGLEVGLEVGEMADGNCDEMEVQGTDEENYLEEQEDVEMGAEDHSHPFPSHQKRSFGEPLMGDMNVPLEIADPRPHLRSRATCRVIPVEDQDAELLKTKRGVTVELSRRSVVGSNKAATQDRLQDNRREVLTDYRKKMEAKAKSTGLPRPDQRYLTSEVSYTTRCMNNVTRPKPATQPPKQDKTKPAVKKQSSGSASRGWCIWGLCTFLGALLFSVVVLGLLAYQNLLMFHAGDGGHRTRLTNPATFEAQLSMLEASFPNQRPDLWRRSRIHLKRHLQTAQPIEPVSLILTAGRGAEKTLHCLARHLASAFSSALNASVLHIDGASKAGQDSDQVKLDIDGQLRGAFGGDKPVAVIHRFEELPPSSTIIFYRYCDHENAAYKHVFLAFTVLLPQEVVGEELGLKEIEELVQDYVKDRFVDSDSSDRQASFSRMDIDKLSGLWSRISHLILPVAAEERIEQTGCMD